MKPTNSKKLTLIQKYYDEAKTKLGLQYHVDQLGKLQGEYKWWFEDGQISSIRNFKDGIAHGKSHEWWYNGRRYYVGTLHFKKKLHGTQIRFNQ